MNTESITLALLKSLLIAGRAKKISPPSIFGASLRSFGQPAAQTHPHLISEGEVTPKLTKNEFYMRRSKLVKSSMDVYRGMKNVKDHLFVFPSSSTKYMTHDIPYVFRQHTDFNYLSGFLEPDSVLVIEGNCNSQNGEHLSKLFVPEKDPKKELWDGPRSGTEGAVRLTGVDAAFNSRELGKYLDYYINTHSDYILWYDTCARESHINDIVTGLISNGRQTCVDNPTSHLHAIRSIKSAPEVELMQQSCDIATEAFIETMRFSHPQVKEAHLWAKMDFECRMRGAQYLAYPPVVAGGPRANIIHYITNNQVVGRDQLVLMDAGCELHGYASDITRTWPVTGGFTTTQRAVYNAVLRVNEACIQLCTTQHSLDDIFMEMCRLIGDELVDLGILSADTSSHTRIMRAREFCPHHVGHHLGMDVHDTHTLSRSLTLNPGNVVTIEPGIYIPTDNLSVDPKYRGIGVRIEDNILITADKPVNMSAACPKTVEDIENLMAKRQNL